MFKNHRNKCKNFWGKGAIFPQKISELPFLTQINSFISFECSTQFFNLQKSEFSVFKGGTATINDNDMLGYIKLFFLNESHLVQPYNFFFSIFTI